MTQLLDLTTAKKEIREKVIELARAIKVDARTLRDDEVIAEVGALDSAGLMELIMWYERQYGLSIDQADLTFENFGTVQAMAEYLRRT